MHCESRQTPYKFAIIGNDKATFSSTHGGIQTSNFSHWAIVLLREFFFHIRIMVLTFFQLKKLADDTIVNVKFVLFKDLRANLEVKIVALCGSYHYNYIF